MIHTGDFKIVENEAMDAESERILEELRKELPNARIIPCAEAGGIPLFRQYGWVCPVCGRGLSPTTAMCPCVNTVTTSTMNK